VQVARRPGHGRSQGAGPLSDGVDPDSLVASGGAELLRETVDRAQGGIEFFVNEVWGKARGNADARARALEDAARLVAKVATQTKRDLFVGTLATGLGVEPAVIRSVIARASGQAGAGPWGRGPGPGPQRAPSHPNAPGHPNAPPAAGAGRGGPDEARGGNGGPPAAQPAAPQIEEVEVIALLADHPSLIATAEADRAFWLLTDARLRDMYSAARERGQSLIELAPVQLPQPTAVIVLSGKYAESKDPRAELLGQIANLEHRRGELELARIQQRLVDAQRRGDRHQARILSQLIPAMRTGDRELVTRLKESLADETSNGKQVD